jgi:hypothetical protein
VKARIFVVLALTFALAATQAIAERTTKPRSDGQRPTALAIGNSACGTAPLRNPVNDARAIAQPLSEVGFPVMFIEDATLAGANRAIREFGDDLPSGGVAS